MILLYIALGIYIVTYLVYSWYWQAMIEFRARFKISSVLWALVFLSIGFSLDYFSDPNLALNAFIAAFILMSIVDGFSGFAKNKLVVSGTFKRTIKYSDISHVTLIPIPTMKRPTVMAIFQTNKRQAFSLRFSKQLEEVIIATRKYLGTNVGIEVRKMF